jgi:hypothetical protein
VENPVAVLSGGSPAFRQFSIKILNLKPKLSPTVPLYLSVSVYILVSIDNWRLFFSESVFLLVCYASSCTSSSGVRSLRGWCGTGRGSCLNTPCLPFLPVLVLGSISSLSSSSSIPSRVWSVPGSDDWSRPMGGISIPVKSGSVLSSTLSASCFAYGVLVLGNWTPFFSKKYLSFLRWSFPASVKYASVKCSKSDW